MMSKPEKNIPETKPHTDEDLDSFFLETNDELLNESFKLGFFPRQRSPLASSMSRGGSVHEALKRMKQMNQQLLSEYSNALADADEHITTQHRVLFGRHYFVLKRNEEMITNMMNVFGRPAPVQTPINVRKPAINENQSVELLPGVSFAYR